MGDVPVLKQVGDVPESDMKVLTIRRSRFLPRAFLPADRRPGNFTEVGTFTGDIFFGRDPAKWLRATTPLQL